jgi:4-hydroxyacetophenone monooxygenase
VRFDTEPQPITASDDEIAAAVAASPVPPLLATVAHLTGDHAILRDDLRPDLTRVLEPDNGYSAEQVALARDLATAALAAFRDAGSVPAPPPDPAGVQRLVEFVAGGPVGDQLPLLEAELALDGADLRAPSWRVEDYGRTFSVGIIGAGMSGIAAAHRLRQAGCDVTILEKNADVGGTWLENDYPGCRVDIQSHFYSYSFAQVADWPQWHAQQPVLLDYFRECVDRFGLRDALRLSTEVVEARWDDGEQVWHVETLRPDGTMEVLPFDAVVSATGQLNRPLLPDIPGMDQFQGPWYHSARWDPSVELAGKRVGVIGTGASAVQFIPRVAEVAEHTTVFQRTPPWLLPVTYYEDDLPDGVQWLLRHAPQYARWDRLWVFVRTQDGLLPLAEVDPEWEPKDRSVGPLNDFLRQMLTAYYDAAFADADLREKVLPTYPPVAKRVVLDNGRYPATLQRDDVTLVTTDIAAVTPTGVRTRDGVEHPFDVLIYGTGFQASKFLTPMKVVGAGGVDLHERWAGDARAYLGITIPDFPNLFLMYGPNTNIVINGSIIYFSECEATYIVESIRMLLEHGKRSMDCRPDVHATYNDEVDAGNRARAWGASDVSSWYKNELGRVAQNWPFNLERYWAQTRHADPKDYVLR